MAAGDAKQQSEIQAFRVVLARGDPMSSEFAHLLTLSPAERLRLVEDLWDSLVTNPQDVPVHEWQKEEFDCREAEHLRDPARLLTWEQIESEIRVRNG